MGLMRCKKAEILENNTIYKVFNFKERLKTAARNFLLGKPIFRCALKRVTTTLKNILMMKHRDINELPKWDLEKGPDFMIIGAAKCGTTTLYTYLSKHPDVYLPKIKEPEFFSDSKIYNKGFEWYRNLFIDAPVNSMKGDTSTTYSRWPHTLDSSKLIFENTKVKNFVYMMRDPVERAFSHYAHLMRHGVTMTFEEALNSHPIIFDTGDYYNQIKRYLKYFKLEDFLFLTLEDFKNTPSEHLMQIQSHIGVKKLDLTLTGQELSNKGGADHYLRYQTVEKWKKNALVSYASKLTPKTMRSKIFDVIKKSSYGEKMREDYKLIPMTKETKIMLIEKYNQQNEKLSKLTGVNVSMWQH